jgi:hypothetical protein
MSIHIVDDEQRSNRRAIPMRPSGSGVAGASASLALLRRCAAASPASRRLASTPATPGTRPILLLGQTPNGAEAFVLPYSSIPRLLTKSFLGDNVHQHNPLPYISCR